MELLILLVIVGVVILVSNNAEKSIKEHDNKITVKVKECPPHAWFWQEVVDQDGNRVGERIVCKRCGPLSNSLGVTDGE